MKISQSLPVLFISLLPVLYANAQDYYPRQQLQEQPDEWDNASWSPPDQDSTGLPGDNFSLQGALTLFKQANSPEEFERLLNTENNRVNNLDLNADGNIDYLRVINKKQNQVQLFIIQALVSNQESQDVAVIELEKTGENNAVIQIAGDEDLYGETTLAEPVEVSDSLYSAEDNSFDYSTSPRLHGPAADAGIPRMAPTGVIVNVWFWPCVRRVYAPAYVVWTSPWSWINPPVWWRPWHPMPVYAYRPVCHHYRYGYAYAPMSRIAPARGMYYPIRTYSGMVYNRNRVIVTNYRSARADRGRFPGRYDGGRYNGYYRNNYNGGRNYYNGYRDNRSGRNNYGWNNNRPGGRQDYYNDRSPGRIDGSIRGGSSRSGGRSGNYQGGSWNGNAQNGGRNEGSRGNNRDGNSQNGGRTEGGSRGGSWGGNSQNGGRTDGSYRGGSGNSNTTGGRTNGGSSGRAGRTRGN
ncbi:hypothetical protein L3C95_10310 [Chitinophaga filiformis]|uniref:hypothetical protein n=1 Tax=Chitinophaga filiformis TaxID=104663 RepID=UPI001F307E21|nr:hypothetical protein [Chitinophaga filiformis]MCF6402814.1 hypothetical protein [Chitinophaga filiformis]MCF6403268.1 hypothetical protein [Chitinophaga filiformis]